MLTLTRRNGETIRIGNDIEGNCTGCHWQPSQDRNRYAGGSWRKRPKLKAPSQNSPALESGFLFFPHHISTHLPLISHSYLLTNGWLIRLRYLLR